MDNFKDAPQSIGELRSQVTGSGSNWTARDALISLLRDIDNGMNVDHIFIAYRSSDETISGFRPCYISAGADPYTTVGIAHRSISLFIEQTQGKGIEE